jgi:hypothetical protein
MTPMNNDLDYLLSPKAVRERSRRLFDAALEGQTHFEVHLDRLAPTVEFVVEVIRENYPDFKIPFHSRWGHFRAGGRDRVAELERAMDAARITDARERARVLLDLVIVSVLLDAGAGGAWSYTESDPGLHTGLKKIARSEGLAVASFWMFLSGAFSSDPSRPLQADAKGLQSLTREALEKGFQVSAHNPLIGVDGRLGLLQSLGRAVEQGARVFPASNDRAGARPGAILDAVLVSKSGSTFEAKHLLRLVLDGLGSIWPGRLTQDGVNLGDCWKHSLLGQDLIPFHKLSQWMTYSLVEPIEAAGVRITGVEQMTGLPEYRNGGLLLDLGLITLRDPANSQRAHLPSSELVIEWRALTIVLLDQIAAGVRKTLGWTEADFPLVKILEGGTWWAGRRAAKAKRADGSPPLKLESDGTVF